MQFNEAQELSKKQEKLDAKYAKGNSNVISTSLRNWTTNKDNTYLYTVFYKDGTKKEYEVI